MTAKDIIFFGGIDWFGPRKLPCHHIVQQLARRNRVFYIDNFGAVRDLRLQDAGRALRKLSRALQPRQGQSGSGTPGIVVCQPLLLPTSRLSAVSAPLNSALLTSALSTLVARHRIQDAIVWTRVPTEVVWRSLARLPHGALVYQSVDHFPYNPAIAEDLRPRLAQYEELFRHSADLLFASARGLAEEKRAHNPETYFFPNGVQPELFRESHRRPQRMDGIGHPIIGFAGAVGPWVDLELIQEAASRTPEWSYVLLGPVSAGVDVRRVQALPNVHLMGAVPHAELPAWFACFDAGIIPYRLSEFTRYTFPSKMAEYLAAGLPVFSTPLPELVPYSRVVEMAASARELTDAIRQHLEQPDTEGQRRARLAVAEELSWESIVPRMEALIDQAFARKMQARSGHTATGGL